MALTPTPVTLEDLIDETSAINTVNDGIVTQEVSPRTKGVEYITVAVTDDPFVAGGYWTQKFLGGEWRRSSCRLGTDEGVSYTLPVNTATVIVHGIVYPIALADIASYPPISSAETA